MSYNLKLLENEDIEQYVKDIVESLSYKDYRLFIREVVIFVVRYSCFNIEIYGDHYVLYQSILDSKFKNPKRVGSLENIGGKHKEYINYNDLLTEDFYPPIHTKFITLNIESINKALEQNNGSDSFNVAKKAMVSINQVYDYLFKIKEN